MRTFRDQARRVPRRKKKREPLFRCGKCGKGYGNPLGHSCGGGGDFARRRRAQDRAADTAKRRAETAERRAREREKITAVRQRERAKARERVAAARKAEREKAKRKRPAGRSRPERHDYRNCRDAECQRVACEAYREGHGDGWMEGYAAGQSSAAGAS